MFPKLAVYIRRCIHALASSLLPIVLLNRFIRNQLSEIPLFCARYLKNSIYTVQKGCKLARRVSQIPHDDSWDWTLLEENTSLLLLVFWCRCRRSASCRNLSTMLCFVRRPLPWCVCRRLFPSCLRSILPIHAPKWQLSLFLRTSSLSFCSVLSLAQQFMGATKFLYH